jgi:hypothetical protein
VLWPEVPPELDALIAQLLAKAPALRPSDGAALAAALIALGPLARSAAKAPRERVRKPQAITGDERRYVSVVLLGRAEERGAATEHAALRKALRPFGGRLAARGAIAEARTRLLAIAEEIPDPDYKQSFLERVPENAGTLALARAWLGEPAPRT